MRLKLLITCVAAALEGVGFATFSLEACAGGGAGFAAWTGAGAGRGAAVVAATGFGFDKPLGATAATATPLVFDSLWTRGMPSRAATGSYSFPS